MLYQITDGTVSAGGHVILSHVNFEIKGNEKIIMYFCKYKLEIKDHGENNGKKHECFGD